MDSTIFKTVDVEVKKQVVQEGKWGIKPYEYSECYMTVECDGKVVKYASAPYVLGNSTNEFERMLDVCLVTMHEEEISEFKVASQSPVAFVINLIKINFNGFIHEWDANKKYKIAQFHKERGVELYKNEKVKDSVYRFMKGLKIILSIPLDVEQPPSEVNGLSIKTINALKANLYNNMASCYLKSEAWEIVIEFCNKVFSFDKDNVKALYKIGVAYRHDKNYELAAKSFEKVLKSQPDHAPAKQHLSFVKTKLKQADTRVNNMMKKMFQGVVE